MHHCDVIVIGGGPVGLLLGNLLGQQGIHCVVIEKRTAPLAQSRAIGVMPPSLTILKHLQLAHTFVQAGVQVKRASVHDERGLLGQVHLDVLPGDYPFVLSLPQTQTVSFLESHLDSFPSIRYLSGCTAMGLEQNQDRVIVRTKHIQTGETDTYCAPFAVGCDGAHSQVRQWMHIPFVDLSYGLSFLMADFEDHSGLKDEAHLFFTPHGSVESFPLPLQRRRWIVQTDRYMLDPNDHDLSDRVFRLSGYQLHNTQKIWQSAFETKRRICRAYVRDRVILCGDAAHVMSPIGGQGMNTGFADAELLAHILVMILRQKAMAKPLFQQYTYYRSQAFAVATRRAEWGMWLGTRQGRVASRLRSLFLKHLLLRDPFRQRLPDHFAMWTIPYHRKDRVPLKTSFYSDTSAVL